jgi:hypothetical protein
MATLTEIKQQLDIISLVLKPEIDEMGNETGYLFYEDVEKGVVVKIHKNLSLLLKENPQMNNLRLRVFEGLYLIDTFPDVEIVALKANNRSVDNSSTPPTSTQTSIYSKPNHKAQNNTEVIVSVIVAGTVAAFLFGFVFWGYYIEGSLEEFNPILGVFSFIIASGSTYLFLKKKSKRRYPLSTNSYNENRKKTVPTKEIKPKCITCNREYPKGTKFCLYDGGAVIIKTS